MCAAALALNASQADAQTTSVYDFSTNAGVDRFAYGTSAPRSPIPPTSNTIPSVEFGPTEYIEAIPVDRIHVAKQATRNAWRADLNGDGVVDTSDIREFAFRNDLALLPAFERKLEEREAVKRYRDRRR
jgi:hypothetical protein